MFAKSTPVLPVVGLSQGRTALLHRVVLGPAALRPNRKLSIAELIDLFYDGAAAVEQHQLKHRCVHRLKPIIFVKNSIPWNYEARHSLCIFRYRGCCNWKRSRIPRMRALE